MVIITAPLEALPLDVYGMLATRAEKAPCVREKTAGEKLGILFRRITLRGPAPSETITRTTVTKAGQRRFAEILENPGELKIFTARENLGHSLAFLTILERSDEEGLKLCCRAIATDHFLHSLHNQGTIPCGTFLGVPVNIGKRGRETIYGELTAGKWALNILFMDAVTDDQRLAAIKTKGTMVTLMASDAVGAIDLLQHSGFSNEIVTDALTCEGVLSALFMEDSTIDDGINLLRGKHGNIPDASEAPLKFTKEQIRRILDTEVDYSYSPFKDHLLSQGFPESDWKMPLETYLKEIRPEELAALKRQFGISENSAVMADAPAGLDEPG